MLCLCSLSSPQYGVTSLHEAAMNGQSEVVSILFAGGANTEATDDEVRREMGLME